MKITVVFFHVIFVKFYAKPFLLSVANEYRLSVLSLIINKSLTIFLRLIYAKTDWFQRLGDIFLLNL